MRSNRIARRLVLAGQPGDVLELGVAILVTRAHRLLLQRLPPAVSVLAESLAIGALGGGFGLLLSYPLVDRGMGRWLEENMGSFFPYFHIAETTAVAALGLAMALGIAAVGEPLVNNPHMQSIYPHLHEQFGYTTPDSLIDHAIQLADNTEKSQRLGKLNAAMFDNYLSPRAAATSILTLLQSL